MRALFKYVRNIDVNEAALFSQQLTRYIEWKLDSLIFKVYFLISELHTTLNRINSSFINSAHIIPTPIWSTASLLQH